MFYMLNLHNQRPLVKRFIKKQSEKLRLFFTLSRFNGKRFNPNLHAPAADHALFLRNVV